MAAVSHFEFAKFRYFVTWPFFESTFVSTHQISLKSDDFPLRYCNDDDDDDDDDDDKIIFKMAAVRHLEFSKFGIFWSRDLCPNVIALLCTKFRVKRTINRWDMARKLFSIWRPSAILNLQNFDSLSRDLRGNKICVCSPNFIEIGWFSAEI